ncbi:MAG: DUF3604 domain-containing protein [Halioglobus sp.]
MSRIIKSWRRVDSTVAIRTPMEMQAMHRSVLTLTRLTARACTALLMLTTGVAGQAADYSPNVDLPAPTRVYWGDTHLHTDASTDAAARGTSLGLEEAYRFARGETVTSSSGQRARLRRPLDFLVVADHSDGMGFFNMLVTGHPTLMKEELGQRWRGLLQEGKGAVVAREVISGFAQNTLPWQTNDPLLMRPVWDANIAAAEAFNDPGNFTALLGFEWTSLVKGNNLHRVVVFRDGADRVSKVLPYTLGDSADPEDLWRYLADFQSRTGGQVLAIPHNANLSNGLMFDDVTLQGGPIDSNYADRRRQWEPLVEVTQIKGDGEAHPFLSPNDEFADFETWDTGNLDLSAAKTPAMLRGEYARAALQRGLIFQRAVGANPYQFGMIGSTDSHTSLPAVEENNFFGKHAGKEPSAKRASAVQRKGPVGELIGWEQVASGYAAVWATDNTREALWDAMKRREVYASTGPRMTLRFFGGWDFTTQDAQAPDLAAVGYRGGVPMGGTLAPRTGKRGPVFLVAALRDPEGANLDRIQIVKGWLNSKGEPRESVFDVAWSGERRPDDKGKLPPVGSSVEADTATWRNNIGSARLAAVWSDPTFEAAQEAFYYARVLEIPTPRWTAYDAARLDADMPDDAPLSVQERVYSSPIWYDPE